MQHTSEKTDETLGIDTCNIHVQPLQHMQHPDLFLQHPSETLAKTHENHCKNISNIQIKHLQHMCETYATSK